MELCGGPGVFLDEAWWCEPCYKKERGDIEEEDTCYCCGKLLIEGEGVWHGPEGQQDIWCRDCIAVEEEEQDYSETLNHVPQRAVMNRE